jgi:hypothetical protein
VGSRVRGAEGARGRRVRVGEAGGEEVWRRSCVLLDGFPWLMLQYVGRLFGMRKGERGGGKGNRRGGGEGAGRVGGKAGEGGKAEGGGRGEYECSIVSILPWTSVVH